MKTKSKTPKDAPPPEEGALSFEEALRIVATTPKKVVDEAMKQAKKKRNKPKNM